MTLVFTQEATFSKCMQWTCLFRGFLAMESITLRVQFLQSFQVFLHRTMFLFNNSSETWLSYTLTFADPSGGVETLAFQARVFNTSLGAQQMLMHRKSCLIPSVFSKLWATSWENLFMPYVNNKGAGQPVHPCSLISTFVVRCLDSIVSLVSILAISCL